MKHRSILYFAVMILLVACSSPKPRKPVVRKTTSVAAESVAINKKMNAIEEAALLAYAKQDSLNTYHNSQKGFWYALTAEKNTAITAVSGDEVLFTTAIEDLQHQIIYEAEEIGVQSYFVDKENIVEGLRDGIKLMHEGAEATFLFPSYKVFGFSGNNDKIDNNQPLVYKIQIIKINKKHESN